MGGGRYASARLKNVIVRPWLQAVSWNSPEYGPQYIATEIRSSTSAGGEGWLMWNPAQTYTVTWQAVPVERKKPDKPVPVAQGD